MTSKGRPTAREAGDDQDDRKWSIKAAVVKFAETTSMHAASRAADSEKHWVTRIFWFLLMLAGIGYSGYNVALIIISYLEYPVSTVVSMEYEADLSFPAVTICNLNPVLKSEYDKIKLSLDYYNDQQDIATTMAPTMSATATTKTTVTITAATTTTKATTTSKVTTTASGGLLSGLLGSGSSGGQTAASGGLLSGILGSASSGSQTAAPGGLLSGILGSGSSGLTGLVSDLGNVVGGVVDVVDTVIDDSLNLLDDTQPFDPSFYDDSGGLAAFQEDSAWDAAKSLRPFLDQLSKEERIRTGHKLNKMLLDCRYQRHRCSTQNFTHFWSVNYGNCYTFNKDVSVESVSKSGPAHGLTLLLNAETDQYVQFSDIVGFKVVVHPPDAMPFPEDEGVVIAPGFATSVAIRRLDVTRTPAPYGRCLDHSADDNLAVNMYALDYNVSYTDKACMRSCYQRQTIQMCHCCDLDFPCVKGNHTEGNTTLTRSNITFCNMDSSTVVSCVNDVRQAIVDGQISCVDACFPACSETQYETEISSGVWPSEASLNKTVSRFNMLPPEFFVHKDNSTDYIRENVAKVEIYFRQLNYERVETVPAYDWAILLSNVGGQLGLWMGFSVLTGVEILGMLLEVVRKLLGKLCCRRSPKQTKVTDIALGPVHPVHY